jgi:hypothetical protein
VGQLQPAGKLGPLDQNPGDGGAAGFVVVNFLVDLLYIVVDPRVRA